MQINEPKKDRFFRIVTIILIILILLLLFFSKFGRINNYAIPTGNVDVFDIDVNCNCENDECRNELTANLGIYDEQRDKRTLGKVFVDDENGDYVYQQNLNIFHNAAFQYTNKIAPGTSNIYHFVVHNSSNINLKYYIEMYEDSEYPINLKYRLKKNNKYILGDSNTWLTAEELKTKFENITYSSSDNYSLDWKWFDEDNEADTIAGKNMTDLYKLNIRFYFEAVEV